MTDTVGYLAKVHFERDVSIEAFFEWTTFVAMKSTSASMLEKISRYNLFLKSERSMGERFLL
ncbi:hypothetical protein WQE_46369 [Paraburkholderia hospita]|uniref:L-proline 3-hydroxylase C-terminal domain-containing protein n=1 Tax=Paraburkholderia hospita TaxID=169430 RepID=A0ABP2P926_9BURK|nr:hypothetical protein [Paraburkholderia hospita]EIM94071.1 hypothetical protein WQE_46369 [Paraburkholderia hospita]OUL77898.1 hypothetical protein CA602_32570 [Paraburkholderia hospita]